MSDTPRTEALRVVIDTLRDSEIIELHEQLERELNEANRENDLIRGLLARLGKSCHYCGLTNIGECKSGFPGCALMDDIMASDSTFDRSVLEERDQLKAELESTKAHLADANKGARINAHINVKLTAELALARKCVEDLRGIRPFDKGYPESLADYDKFKQENL